MSEYYILAICISLFLSHTISFLISDIYVKIETFTLAAGIFSILGTIVFIIRWLNRVVD